MRNDLLTAAALFAVVGIMLWFMPWPSPKVAGVTGMDSHCTGAF